MMASRKNCGETAVVPAGDKVSQAEENQNIVTSGVSMLRKRLAGHDGEYFNSYILEMLAHVDTGLPQAVEDPDTMDGLYLDAEDNHELVRVDVRPEQIIVETTLDQSTTIYKPTVSLTAPNRGPEGEIMFNDVAIVNIGMIEAEFNA